MSTELQMWLRQATRHLSSDSATQVRIEIQEHYQAARDAAMSAGSTGEEADRSAIAALGSAKAANRQYRGVLLTSAEASMLREGNRYRAPMVLGDMLGSGLDGMDEILDPAKTASGAVAQAVISLAQLSLAESERTRDLREDRVHRRHQAGREEPGYHNRDSRGDEGVLDQILPRFISP